MALLNGSGLNVANHYGTRDTGGTVGVERSTGSIHQLSLELTGNSLISAQDNSGVLPGAKFVLPAGALILRYRLRVDEAFAIAGTSPTVRIGSQASISTNGVVLTEAEMENVGTKTPASGGAGTWATSSSTGLTAAANVAIDFGGSDVVITPNTGQATLIVEYVYKNRTVS